MYGKMEKLLRCLGIIGCVAGVWLPGAWSQSWPSRGGTLFVESIDAVVNDEIILAGEVEERLELVAINGRYNLEDAETYEAVRGQILRQMIDDLLIYQWGVENGMGLRKDQLEQRVDAEISFRNENEEIKRAGGLEAALESVGRTMESYRQSLAESIEREYVIRSAVRLRIDEKIHISDAYIERFRINNPDLFQKEQRVEVSQLFLKCPKNAPPEKDEETRARSQQIYLQLKAGADFVDLVRRYSDHEATRSQGGKMAPYSRGELAKPFDIAFDLDVGEICEPFRTPAGYHILRLDRKQTIQDYVLNERKKEMLAAWLEELRAKAVIRCKQAEPGI